MAKKEREIFKNLFLQALCSSLGFSEKEGLLRQADNKPSYPSDSIVISNNGL
jgi:hypothetical protein